MAKCRKCPDGTWADLSTGKCPGECPEGQVQKPDGTCGCPVGQTLTEEGKCTKPPEPPKCQSPCYCGLYSNKPKCGLVDCEQLCVREGYDPLETYEPRPLMPSEKKILPEVFGDSIDYNEVIIKHKKGKGKPFTEGNTITMYDTYIEPDGRETLLFENNKWTDLGKAALVHEATHIWQDQHTNFIVFWLKKRMFGAELFIRAFKAEYDSDPKTDTKTAIKYMYNWRRDVDRGVSFEKLNYEQQAEVVKEYFKGSYEEKYKEYMQEAIKKIRAKK